MSFKSALVKLFEPSSTVPAATDPRNTVQPTIFANVRTLMIIAFAGLLIWNATSKLLAAESLEQLFRLLMVFVIAEATVHITAIIVNGFTKNAELKSFTGGLNPSATQTAILAPTVAVAAPKTP